MWVLLIFTILATFLCYWLNSDSWAMYEREPIGSIGAGLHWSLEFLTTFGLIPILWTIIILIDHRIASSTESETTRQLEVNLNQKLAKPFYKDKFRMIATIILVFVSLPWIFALIGVFIGDIPGLNFFMSKQVIPWEDNLPAVHLGMHHGFAGFFLCVSVILISYNINWIKNKNLKKFWGILFNIVLFLGIYFVLQDFMNEQFYNFFRLNGIDLPILNLIPFEPSDFRMYIVLVVIIITGILSYQYIWKNYIEIHS
jgi:hypothetical protein